VLYAAVLVADSASSKMAAATADDQLGFAGAMFDESDAPTWHTVSVAVPPESVEAVAAAAAAATGAVPAFRLSADRRTLEVTFHSRAAAAGAACRGGDLTGFCLFPETRLLAQYIADHSSCFHGRRVIELGAGLALPSRVAAACGASVPVVVTDGCEDVLSLSRDLPMLLDAHVLRWGADSADIAPLRHQFDIVHGSGVAYNVRCLDDLLATVVALMEPSRAARYVIGFTNRQVKFENLVGKAKQFSLVLITANDASPGNNVLVSQVVDGEHAFGIFVFGRDGSTSADSYHD
jgi:hypothetical protein